jgi:hypothetical protein
MRENDDDAPVTEPHGSLADGLGETDSGGYESSGDPYGDVDFDDDAYGDDGTDGTYGEDGTSDDGTDEGSAGGDGSYDDDGTYGDGDGQATTDDEVVDVDDEADDVDVTVDDGPPTDDEAFVAQDASPLEGIGFLLDEVREALFGDDDAAAASPFDTDPVDLETDTDLDLTGDGVVDRADLHEAASSFDFGVSGSGHHGHHHDDGVMDG